ncbi:MAG: histone deacetylase [Pseudomonadota bacterium]
MIIYYHPQYNFNLGILGWLHPFDGKKFAKVHKRIAGLEGITIVHVEQPIDADVINGFVGELLRRLLDSKRYILQALEVPYIPLLPFSIIDHRILVPMRWAVAGTLAAARTSLTGVNAWNLAGGYHHASKKNAQGFCIYNDVGIAVEELLAENALSAKDEILIIDVDAHHGNGNAYVFMENDKVTILDIYNNDIYPRSDYTKERVNINIQLRMHTSADEYLSKLKSGLDKIRGGYKVAFVVAGTDVLESDPLGGLNLSIADCVARDKLVLDKLHSLSIPAVFLGGGGYGRESAAAIIGSISAHYRM